MSEKQEREAVFWCGLLHPVLFGEIPKGQVAAYLRELCQQAYWFPDGKYRRPSVSTLKRKLRKYRKDGFAGVLRKVRSDRGQVRCVPQAVIDTAIAAKQDQPLRSDRVINLILEGLHGKQLKRSTLYRHLKKAGATRQKLGVSKKRIRKRWTKDHTHDMWMGDFSHGPYVLVNGVSVRSHLSVFIDVHSRYIVAGRYYLKEDLDILCDTLIRGLAVHGAPLALYVDNAQAYYAYALKKTCYRLHINLLHRPPRDPATGGLVERFIATVQGQFESEVRNGQILSLQDLNQTFSAWLDVCYHPGVHSETKESPKERYQKGLGVLRQVDMEAVAESFLQSEKRTVDPIFCDIRLHGRMYRVDEKLRGDRLEVRYDPFGDGSEVFLYTLEGQYLGKGRRHEREKGAQPRQASETPAHLDVLGLLKEKQKRLWTDEDLDFRHATTPNRWPFAAFASGFADLLGRKAGINAV